MDIFFISFNESSCEDNWKQTLKFHPNAIRIHGVKGIDRVHLTCNQLSTTDYFWTIDGDNFLTEALEYTDPVDVDLIMFKAVDPLHDSLTLLGGVKLWKKDSMVNKTMNKGDFCLNATNNKKVVDKAYSITAYNSSEFDAWKTSFRHCVKLMSIIFRSRPNAKNIDTYINQWKSCKNIDRKNAVWSYRGYLDAKRYVSRYDENLDKLYKINDYEWLVYYFNKRYKNDF